MTDNCRFCLRFIDFGDKIHQINDEIKFDFYNVTQMELVTSEYHINVVCELCLRSLQLASSLRNQLIENQEKFYKDFENATNIEEPTRRKKNTFEYNDMLDMNLDSVKQESQLGSIVIEYPQMMDNFDDRTCDICFKTYKDKYKLLKHKSTHLEKTITCPVCGKKFNRSENLKAHMVYHNEPKFTCDLCSRKYYEKSSLKNHLVSNHLKTKDYKCQFCTKSYFKINLLNRHISTIHKNEKFVCGVGSCMKEFNYKHHCKIHIAKIHQHIKHEDIEGLITFTKQDEDPGEPIDQRIVNDILKYGL